MNRRFGMIIPLLAGAVAAGCGPAKSGQVKTPPPVVLYDRPIISEVTDYEEFPGRTDAIFSVEIRARVSGYLDRVYFQDGLPVSKGDLLFQIDPRPFKAELDRAKATVIQAEAHSKRLKADFRRAAELYNRGALSREEYDKYSGDLAEADAAVEVSRASQDLAALNLEFTRVTAPISGRLSRRLVDPGNLIKADETPLTSIVSQDPVYVYFDVHEQAMLKIRRLIQEGKVRAHSESEVPVLIKLSDEEGFPHQGMVDFTDNRVDLNTGTLRFRAKLANPKQMITPGLFVRVRLPIGDPHPALMVREQSLVTDQGRKEVFVLQPKQDSEGKPLKDEQGRLICVAAVADVGTPGVLRDGYREVQKGVNAGDLVVVSGMQRIRMGMEVRAGEFKPLTGAGTSDAEKAKKNAEAPKAGPPDPAPPKGASNAPAASSAPADKPTPPGAARKPQHDAASTAQGPTSPASSSR